jgi:hypothetical protein
LISRQVASSRLAVPPPASIVSPAYPVSVKPSVVVCWCRNCRLHGRV